jgi:hypothetical protein
MQPQDQANIGRYTISPIGIATDHHLLLSLPIVYGRRRDCVSQQDTRRLPRIDVRLEGDGNQFAVAALGPGRAAGPKVDVQGVTTPLIITVASTSTWPRVTAAARSAASVGRTGTPLGPVHGRRRAP